MKTEPSIWALSLRLVLLVALFFAVLLGGRALLFEKVVETDDIEFTGEAVINRFLALQRLYTRLNVPTQSEARLSLPPVDEVLIVATKERGPQLAKLVEWVEAGGRLVIIPAANGQSESLLETFGLGLFEKEDADEDDHLSEPAWASQRPQWPRLYASDTDNYPVLRSEGAEDAAWTLTVGVGEGQVTAVAEGDFLSNENLDQSDHALIAWQLIAADPLPRRVHILFRDHSPSIFALLNAKAWPAVLSSLALVLAIGLFRARRIGPLAPATTSDRRHLAEHVGATGSYLWHVRCEEILLRAQRQALRQRVAGTAANTAANTLANAVASSEMSSDELAVLCRPAAEAIGCSDSELAAALDRSEVRDPRRFTQMIQTLESLRRSI